MQLTKMQLTVVPAACAVVMLASAVVISQPAKTAKTDTATVVTPAKKEVPADTSQKTTEIKSTKKTAATTTPTAEAGYWTCSMHPEVHQAEAGTCPKCGMKLVFKKNETDTTKMKGMEHGNIKK